jgi:hypothetical protein
MSPRLSAKLVRLGLLHLRRAELQAEYDAHILSTGMRNWVSPKRQPWMTFTLPRSYRSTFDKEWSKALDRPPR